MDDGEARSEGARIVPDERPPDADVLGGAPAPSAAAESRSGTAGSEPGGNEPGGIETGFSEKDLIEAAKRDPARFADLYRHNFNRVYGYIARRVRDRAAAEDLTADVFHDALRNLDSFEWRGAPFGAWLIRIAANAIVDRAKHAAREQEALTSNKVDSGDPEARAAMGAVIEEIENRARLSRLVDALPVDQRRVIKLRFVEEKSIRDIALQLGRTEGAIKQLQFRALQNLRVGMDGEMKSEE
jgi:RNA polymerase sigma-70 factor (ECF subfamily)